SRTARTPASSTTRRSTWTGRPSIAGSRRVFWRSTRGTGFGGRARRSGPSCSPTTDPQAKGPPRSESERPFPGYAAATRGCAASALLELDDVLRRRPLRALDHVELDRGALGEGLEPVSLDRVVMDE